MADELNYFDAASGELKSGYKHEISLDLSVAACVAILTSIIIHIIFGPISLFIRICCFPIFFPREAYAFLKGVIIIPFFSARFFTTVVESGALLRAGVLFVGYVVALFVIRLMFLAFWLLGIVWGVMNWTVAVSAITFAGGMVVFGGQILTYLIQVSPVVLTRLVNKYVLFMIRFSDFTHWLSESRISEYCFLAVRAIVRLCVWDANPSSLPIFKFAEPEDLRQKLEIRQGQFRLLHIHRRLPFLELHADLEPYIFGASPEYECVSYCWGPQQLDHSTHCPQRPGQKVLKGEENSTCCKMQPVKGSMHLIILNSHQHYIPTNVHSILHRRSSLLRPTCIWIDSICINQLDKAEKNHQVPMMKSIYEQASHVYVCLGEDRTAWLALSMINELLITFTMSDPKSFADHVASLHFRRIGGKDPALTARMEALNGLLANPWFTRVWVFQEVVFARAITILHGNSIMMWDYFGGLELLFSDPRYHQLVAAFTYSGETFSDRRFKGLHQFAIMDRTRRARIETGFFFRGLRLVDVLLQTSIFEATEPVDKVFAVLACAHGFDESKGMIDYTVPLETTLLKVALKQLETGQLLESLQYAGIGWREGDGSVGGPSWVVDWSIPRPPAGTLAHSPQHSSPYQCGLYKQSEISLYTSTSENSAHSTKASKLLIRGQTIDIITDLTSICSITQYAETTTTSVLLNLPEQIRWINEAKLFLATHFPSKTASEQEEFLWRLAIGDRSPTNRPADPSYGKYFQWTQSFLVDLQSLAQKHGTEPEDLPILLQAIRDHGPFGEITSPEKVSKLVGDMVRGDLLYGNPAFPRTIAVTREFKFVGMVPKGTKVGDVVVVFWGAETPFVLRPGREGAGGREYQIVGECYFSGLMDGEGDDDRFEEERFVIF